MRSMISRTVSIVTAALVAVIAIVSIGRGVDEIGSQVAEVRRPTIRSVGAIEQEGMIRYQIFVTGGEQATEGATVTSVLPAHASLLRLDEPPRGVTWAGNVDGELIWTLDEIPADASIEPIAFVIELLHDETVAPASNYARLGWSGGAVEAPVLWGVLEAVG
jgi:hypothetical protein